MEPVQPSTTTMSTTATATATTMSATSFLSAADREQMYASIAKLDTKFPNIGDTVKQTAPKKSSRASINKTYYYIDMNSMYPSL